jgi:predicted nucleic acid-binding protein
LRLPDAIVLDTAIVHASRMILTFDRQLAEEARTREIDSPH